MEIFPVISGFRGNIMDIMDIMDTMFAGRGSARNKGGE